MKRNPHTAALIHEKEIQIKQATTLPEITQVLIQVCEQLGKKTELHVHFIINSTVVGNNVTGNNNDIVSGNDNIVVADSTISDSAISSSISKI
jgi:phosphoserine aminotransferase